MDGLGAETGQNQEGVGRGLVILCAVAGEDGHAIAAGIAAPSDGGGVLADVAHGHVQRRGAGHHREADVIDGCRRVDAVGGVAPVEVETVDVVAVAHARELRGGDQHLLMLPRALLGEPVRTVGAVAGHTMEVVIHAVHGRRVVAGGDRHHGRVEPVDAEELVVRGTAHGLPVEGELQLGGAVGNQDVAERIDAARGARVGVGRAVVVGDVHAVGAAQGRVHFTVHVRGLADVPLVGLRAVHETPLDVVGGIFEIGSVGQRGRNRRRGEGDGRRHKGGVVATQCLHGDRIGAVDL